MKKNIIFMILFIIFVVTFLCIGFSSFGAELYVDGISANIRPTKDINVRIDAVSIDNSNSNGYIVNEYDYNVNSIIGSFSLNNIGSKITFNVDVTVYGNIEMAIKNLSFSTGVSGLKASVTGYNLKEKICDNNNSSKCTLNATKTMNITIERVSGNTSNYSNVSLFLNYKPVHSISYVSMSNTGYPTEVLDGDSIQITFSSNSSYNGTVTYDYTGDILIVNSYTANIPSGFIVSGNNTYSFNNNILSIDNVTDNITITKDNSSGNTAVDTIMSLVDGYPSNSQNVININNDIGSCTSTFAYDGTSDNNLRYVGADSCNYVSFKGITWRIIGVFNNINVDGKEEKESLVKLISTVDYPNDVVSWNTNSNTNNWLASSTYATLNGDFYTNTLGSSNFIENVKWPLGGVANVTNPRTFYTSERNTSDDSSANDDHNPSGYVGLFYASDYGYATSGSNDSTRNTCLGATISSNTWRTGNSNRVCASNDWLYMGENNFYWTITPRSTSSNSVLRIGRASAVMVQISNSQTGFYRPVIFLKSTVKINGGDGSLEKPYTLK